MYHRIDWSVGPSPTGRLWPKRCEKKNRCNLREKPRKRERERESPYGTSSGRLNLTTFPTRRGALLRGRALLAEEDYDSIHESSEGVRILTLKSTREGFKRCHCEGTLKEGRCNPPLCGPRGRRWTPISPTAAAGDGGAPVPRDQMDLRAIPLPAPGWGGGGAG